jgi:hypothetical protein
MKTKETKAEDVVKVSRTGLLRLVAESLKDKELFSKKIEEDRTFLKKVKLPPSLS